jgi:hypothetical protein
MSFSARIPGHDRDMARRGARVDPGAGAVGDLVQDRGDPLVGEAEADPGQVPGPHQVAQDVRQFAGVRAAVLRGGQDDRVGAVVLAVGEQDRQLGLAEHVSGPPPVQAQLVLPRGEAGGLVGHPSGRRRHEFADQPGPQRIQRARHPGAEERHGLTVGQVPAQRR